MQYRTLGKAGLKVSVLGLGLMRLPTTQPEMNREYRNSAGMIGPVDVEKSREMIEAALEGGINFFDSGFPYCGGQSEPVLGRILEEGKLRDQVVIQTKAPTWSLHKPADFDHFLNEQLKRLRTDRIDSYIFHGMNGERWRLMEHSGIVETMARAKKAGKIRAMGFSFHGNLDVFKKIIDYTPEWDTTLIQLNYLDDEYQAGLEGMRYAHARGLGVTVMEPLRGGLLADVPKEIREIFSQAEIQKSPVEWGLDYVWDLPEITCAFSGMGKVEMIRENCVYADRARAGMLTEAEHAVISRVKARFGQYDVIPCTGCAYCIPCPTGVAIPQLFTTFNRLQMGYDAKDAKNRYDRWVPMFGLKADACFDCHRCEKWCPQRIQICAELKRVRKAFEEI